MEVDLVIIGEEKGLFLGWVLLKYIDEVMVVGGENPIIWMHT